MDRFLDWWETRPALFRPRGLLIMLGALLCLLIGGAAAFTWGGEPTPTAQGVTTHVTTLPGSVTTRKVTIRVTKNGKTHTIHRTISVPTTVLGTGPTSTSFSTINGTTFVTVTKTQQVPVTGPTTTQTITTTIVTTVNGPGNTITLTSTVTSPPPPPVTQTVTSTVTSPPVTCTLGVDC